MPDAPAKPRRIFPGKGETVAASGPDERDATIERLERAVDEERRHAATLRKTAEDLRFKAGILERSYAKQLDDARLRAENTERELADLQARMTELEAAHQEALELLAEARAELERAPAGRGRLRGTLRSVDGTRTATAGREGEPPVSEGSLTINKLMDASSWSDEQTPDDREREDRQAQVPTDDAPSEELIAPGLVFTNEGEDDA